MRPNTFRMAVYPSLGISVFGIFLICSMFEGGSDTMSAALEWSPQIIVGYFAMIVFIEGIGIPLRRQLARYWAGALFGLVLFLIGVTAGSATSMIVYNDYDPFAYIIKPLYWLGLYGFIPALIIGLFGVVILSQISNKMENKSRHATTNSRSV